MIFHLAPWADTFVGAIDKAGIAAAESLRGYGGRGIQDVATGDIVGMHSGLTAFMKVITEIFDPTIVIIASCLIVAFFMYKKMRFQATRFLVSILAISGIVWIAKNIVVRARPAAGLIAETGFSFPSGHAAVSLVFFMLLYMSLADLSNGYLKKHRVLRWVCLIVAIIMPILIGFSRVYLGVHYLSDVLAGYIFGAIIAALARLLSEKYRREQAGK